MADQPTIEQLRDQLADLIARLEQIGRPVQAGGPQRAMTGTGPPLRLGAHNARGQPRNLAR